MNTPSKNHSLSTWVGFCSLTAAGITISKNKALLDTPMVALCVAMAVFAVCMVRGAIVEAGKK